MGSGDLTGLAARARAWHHARHVAVCDMVEPWAHGTIVRASRYPTYWDYNAVRLEEEPETGADGLIEVADKALAGLAHRRIDVDLAHVADSLRPEFEARGWNSLRLLFMHREPAPAERREVPVEEVGYDEVADLRLTWHREDFPDQPNDHAPHAKEVAMLRNARVLAVREEGAPVAFAQLEYAADGAEITQVYVHPDRRGDGLGTALTASAISAAGPVADLWIAADADDRPQHLYARLGFRPAWTSMELTRLPSPAPSATD